MNHSTGIIQSTGYMNSTGNMNATGDINEQVLVTIISDDFRVQKLTIKASVDRTFDKLSNQIISELQIDPNAKMVVFYQDESCLKKCQPMETLQMFGKTPGEITLFAKVIFIIRITVIFDSDQLDQVEISTDETLEPFILFWNNLQGHPLITPQKSIEIIPPPGRGQKRLWSPKDYGKSFMEMGLNYDIALRIQPLSDSKTQQYLHQTEQYLHQTNAEMKLQNHMITLQKYNPQDSLYNESNKMVIEQSDKTQEGNYISIKLIGKDIGDDPINVKIRKNSDFPQLQELIQNIKGWDPEECNIKFFTDPGFSDSCSKYIYIKDMTQSSSYVLYAKKVPMQTRKTYVQLNVTYEQFMKNKQQDQDFDDLVQQMPIFVEQMIFKKYEEQLVKMDIKPVGALVHENFQNIVKAADQQQK